MLNIAFHLLMLLNNTIPTYSNHKHTCTHTHKHAHTKIHKQPKHTHTDTHTQTNTHTHIYSLATTSSYAHLAEPGCLCTRQALGAVQAKLLEPG